MKAVMSLGDASRHAFNDRVGKIYPTNYRCPNIHVVGDSALSWKSYDVGAIKTCVPHMEDRCQKKKW